MKTNEKIRKIREIMKREDVSCYIIPTGDPHGSEYVPAYYEDRSFISGFTGSNGIVVITFDEALLWTDGRYFIQASKEIEGSEFKLMKIATPGYDTYEEYIYNNLLENDTVGLNGKVFSQANYDKLFNLVNKKNIKIKDIDIVKEIWLDRPGLSMENAFIHEVKYSGLTAIEKIENLRKKMRENNNSLTIISSLDDIAWLYNIRGKDIDFNPVVLSYAIITENRALLFSFKEKYDKSLLEHLEKNSIELFEYEEIFDFVEKLNREKITLNKEKTNHSIYKLINDSNVIKDEIEITTHLKAIKNKVELENQRKAYIRDGVALTKFIYWLKNHPNIKEVNEYKAAEKLNSLRGEQDLFVENSFGVISAFGANAAMMHYNATKESNSYLDNRGLYLVDSGGQYYDGTTDTTRTIALGELTDEEVTDFTLVLKSSLSLINCIFLEGSTGYYLDAIARYPIWQNSIDYKCGTGHGVGYFLSVHEGPHRISPNVNNNPLLPGMIVTIEPGIYKENKHGIRTENVVNVIEHAENEHGKFYAFELLSFVPIDVDAIKKELLTEKEIEQLNYYNSLVYEKISPYLSEDEKLWLKENTKEI